MTRTTSKKARASRASLQAERKHRRRAVALLVATAAGVVTNYMTPSLFPTPMNTSVLKGMGWVRELLTGHPTQFYDAFAMPKHVFQKLVTELKLYAGLKSTKYICAEEQVALFLHMCKTGGTVRDMRERFQHSPDTISR
jgi:hypothetical protein